MNRKISAGLAVAATLLLMLCLAGSVDALRKGISSTSRVVIDGRSLLSDDSAVDAGSLVKRELDKLGVRLPDGFDPGGGPGTSHPAFAGRLKDSPLRKPAEAPGLPAGLIAEHTLRMEGEAMPIDIFFGSLGTTGPSIRNRLLSCGWESVPTGKDPGKMHMLQLTHGKETSIVYLDEADRTFLFFREVGR
jgi:hypothetical protein